VQADIMNVTANATDGTPEDRWDDSGVDVLRNVTRWALFIAVIVLVIADIFSENFIIGIILLLVAGFAGMIAMSSWVNMQEKLDEENTGEVESSDGVFCTSAAWVLCFVGAALYCCNLVCAGGDSDKSKSQEPGKRDSISHV